MIGSGCIVDVSFVYDRKSEMEYCSASGIGLHPDSSVMRLDDGARNRQTDAHALTLGRYERLEQLLGDLGRNSRTAVGYADPDQTAVRRRDGDDELARLRRFHRTHRLADQIEQDLLDLHAVGDHQIDARVELELHAYAEILHAHQR